MKNDKILIVEDNHNTSLSIKKSLEKEDYIVIQASDGYEALYKFIKEKPQAVILNIDLPKLNGYEVCREIRRIINDTRTPIIMTAGQKKDYDRIRSRVLGATRYLPKPFELEELMEELRSLPHKKV